MTSLVPVHTQVNCQLTATVRDQSDRLLQRSARQRAVNLNRQASTSPQRSALETFSDSGLYKFTFYITFLHYITLHYCTVTSLAPVHS